MASDIPEIPEPAEMPGHELDGTFVGAIEGRPCVDRDAGTIDPSSDPHSDCRAAVADVRLRDEITLDGEEYQVLSQRFATSAGRGLVSLTVEPSAPGGTLGTLWVDREPYLLDVCNGGVYAYELEDVTTHE